MWLMSRLGQERSDREGECRYGGNNLIYMHMSRVSLYVNTKAELSNDIRLSNHIHCPTSGIFLYISSYCLATQPVAAPPLASTPKLPAIHKTVTAVATPLMRYHRLFFISLSDPMSVTWSGVKPSHFAQPHVMCRHPIVNSAPKPAKEIAGCLANACET